MTKTHHLTGGCQCGAVRYGVAVNNHDGFYCHCRMCQKAFGNIFGTFIHVRKDAVEWQSKPQFYRSSPIAARGFCAQCGTPISFAYDDSDEMDLSVGSLDQADSIVPRFHFGVESRLPHWHHDDGLREERADDYAPLQARWEKTKT